MLHLPLRLPDLRREIGGQPADSAFDPAEGGPVFAHSGKPQKRQHAIGFQLDDPLHHPAHAVRRDMLVEHGDPRKTGIIDIEGEMQLRRAVAEQVRGDGPALHRRLHLFGRDAAWRLAADFQPDGMKHRGRDAPRPGKRKRGIGGIKGVIQKSGRLAVALFDEADRQEFGVLLDPDGIAAHFKTQEFRPLRD